MKEYIPSDLDGTRHSSQLNRQKQSALTPLSVSAFPETHIGIFQLFHRAETSHMLIHHRSGIHLDLIQSLYSLSLNEQHP